MSDANSSKRVRVWVQHRADRPYLCLEWNDPETGRRRSKSAETCNPAEAEDARADLESDLNNGRHVDTSNMSWEKFRELFEDEFAEARRERTRENYQATFNLLERLCRPKRLKDVDARMLSKFEAAMRKEPTRNGSGMMPSTIRVWLNFLHSALSWAVAQKLIPSCPSFPAVKVPKKKPQPVSAEAFERLLAAAEGDDVMRAYLMAGWYGGLRLEEACFLEWEPADRAPYLDLGRDRIVFPAEIVKADEDQWIPLAPELREAVEGLQPDQLGRAGPVFRFRHPKQPDVLVGPHSVSTRIAALARKAGVKMTMRSLRRGFGCRWAGKVSAHVLQRLMRHSDIKVTIGYYANLDDAVEEAVLGPRRVASRVSSANKDGKSS
jgi:integrase